MYACAALPSNLLDDHMSEWQTTSEIGLWIERGNTFIGRDTEIQRLEDLLDNARLVTLFGAAGVGKTRMCAQWLSASARSAIVCELEHIQTRQQLWSALGRALGLVELEPADVESANAQILSALTYADPSVLVLDNFEHLVDHGDLLLHWLEEAPQHRALLTSRRRLQLRGERGLELRGLSTEDGVALFEQRAEELLGFFDPTDEEAHAVTRIVRYFDGTPLAIELAASQLLVRTPAHITSSLEEETLDMPNAFVDVPDRQRTLRDAMRSTWELLEEDAREVLQRISYFRGACSLEDIQTLCAEMDANERRAIFTLRNHSLLRPLDGGASSPLFRLNTTARHFARDHIPEDARPPFQRRYITQVLDASERAFARAARGESAQDDAEFWERVADLRALSQRALDGVTTAEAARAGLLIQRANRRLGVLGRDDEVELNRLERMLPEVDDLGLRIDIRIERAFSNHVQGFLEEAAVDDLISSIHELPEAHSPRRLGVVEQIRARIHAREMQLVEALASEQRAAQHFRDAGLIELETRAALDALLFAATMAQTGLESDPSVEDLLNTCARLTTRLERRDYAEELAYLRALAISATGDLNEAIRRAEEGIARARDADDPEAELRWLRQYHFWNIRAGDRDRAVDLATEYIALSKRLGVHTNSIVIQQCLAMIDMGHPREAKRLLDEEIDLTAGRTGAHTRAPAHVIRALVALHDLRVEDAVDECDEAIEEYTANDARAGLAFALGVRSVAHHISGATDVAASDANRARDLLKGSSSSLDTARLIALDCFAVIRTEEDQETMREQLNTLASKASQDITSRLALGLVNHLLDHTTELPQEAQQPADLRLPQDAAWFELPDAERVDLRRRTALRLILAELLDRRLKEPGEGASMYDLIEVGWPDEPLDLDSGTNRVRATIHTLRSLGLRGLLLNRDGYLLDPDAEIFVTSS